jgi:hypothetical protein
MTIEFLENHYHSILDAAYKANELDECIYEELKILNLETLEGQEGAYKQMLTELDRKKLSDRILKGAELIETEKDPVMKRRYIAIYDELIAQLTGMNKPA